MKIEKKTIALCLIALVTGIAIVLPIAYNRGVITTVHSKPLFNVDVLYANATDTSVSAIVNVTTTSEAAKLKTGEVKMEIYNFHFYTEQTSIANVTYTMDMSLLTTKDLPNGQNVITVGSHLPGSIAITDESRTIIDYSSIVSYTSGIGGYTFQRDEKSHVMGVGANLAGNILTYIGEVITISGGNFSGTETPESPGQYTVTFRIPESVELEYLRSAQSLYVEVTRIMSVTYHHTSANVSATPSTTTVLANNEVVANIELTKVDGGFEYGDYEQIVKAVGRDISINYNSKPLVSAYIITDEDFTANPANDSED
jgi:hypothetical protein